MTQNRKNILTNSKICFGPMSMNIIDCIINLSNSKKIPFTLIPSRRQIEFNGGYVNNWTTKEFSEYVYSKSSLIAIQRDHSGPGQGLEDDDGYESLKNDCLYFDSIHIDPWKKYQDIDDGIKWTIDMINYCNNINSNLFFEIGTEEAIRRLSYEDIKYLLEQIKLKLKPEIFDRIIFCVLQSGTALKNGENIGIYSKDKLNEMIKVIHEYGLLSKEHNGDFMEESIRLDRFKNGLDSLNIAPELGIIETKCILDNLNETEFEKIYNICYKSNKWVKWVNKDFIPEENKRTLTEICGHYLFSNPEFVQIKNNIPNIESIIIKTLTDFITSILKNDS